MFVNRISIPLYLTNKKGLAVEVIAQPAEFNYEFECRGCKVQLRADATDVKRGRFGVKDEYSTEYYVTCPICNSDHIIKRDTVPPHVRQLADNKEK